MVHALHLREEAVVQGGVLTVQREALTTAAEGAHVITAPILEVAPAAVLGLHVVTTEHLIRTK